MLGLRLLVVTLSLICLMEGSSNPGASVTNQHPSEKVQRRGVQIMERKKPGKKPPKKCKKFKKKKCLQKCKVCYKIKDCIKCCSKWCNVEPPPLITTVTLTTTATTTITSTSTTTVTTSTTTTTDTTTETTTSTASTAPLVTTATTSSPQTPTNPGAGGECKATNGKSCIFPFKDGNTEYNECKNHGNYYWCATSVHESGKWKHWSYCPTDGSCPPIDPASCKATNNKPCIFPFKDGKQEYNECADQGGKYFWCATGTNSDGKYTAWSYCPKDGSCPLPQKITPPGSTSPLTISTTALPNTASSLAVTTAFPQESASTNVLVKDGEKVFTCQMNFTFKSKAGFEMNANFSSTCSPASSANKDYKNFEEYTFDITTSSGATINCKVNIVIQDESSGISMATKPMEKSLECAVDELTCVTTSGEHFPTSCVVPFIHEGRKYQACTDKGGKDADKLWCATAVDENEEMTTWGYCSAACGYCGGKDITEQDVKAPGAACGYDCLINPNKPMEPKTQEINPKLLTAPEVSYYKDEMTDWNLRPNGQVQFRQGEPGVFLKCKDGFNQFPCHDNLYIKCDGNYKFSIYVAKIKDNTAEIGEFIQNDVKNVQIGCGPCPIGFIYKVGDEVCKYTSCGTYNGVPSIEACRDLCDKRNCPTFVYSLEDKYCELHSVRVDTPSYQEYKDYKLCAKAEENSCESTCSKTQDGEWTLLCPSGYVSAKTPAPSLYKLTEWTDRDYSKAVCANDCNKNVKCIALQYSSECKKCKLLTNQPNSGESEKKYCILESMCSSSRVWPFTRGWTLNCPAGYIQENNGPAKYNMWWLFHKMSQSECITYCQNEPNCETIIYNDCGKCQLLQNINVLSSTTHKRYCAPNPCIRDGQTDCWDGIPHNGGKICLNNIEYYSTRKNKCIGTCRDLTNYWVDKNDGCMCGTVYCPKRHRCVDVSGTRIPVCTCDWQPGTAVVANVCVPSQYTTNPVLDMLDGVCIYRLPGTIKDVPCQNIFNGGCNCPPVLIACPATGDYFVDVDIGCMCGTVHCPKHHRCITDNGLPVCTCTGPGFADPGAATSFAKVCPFTGLTGSSFCIYRTPGSPFDVPCFDSPAHQPGNLAAQAVFQACYCSPALDCPDTNYLDKHVCDNSVTNCIIDIPPATVVLGGPTFNTWPCINNCLGTNNRHKNAWFFSIKRNMDARNNQLIPFGPHGKPIPAPQRTTRGNTVIFQAKDKEYTLSSSGICTMLESAAVYECNRVPEDPTVLRNEMNNLGQPDDYFIGTASNNNKGCKKVTINSPTKTCFHSLVKDGHLDTPTCNTIVK